ncbi:MAG: MCE family protein [Mycobacterium sp.]
MNKRSFRIGLAAALVLFVAAALVVVIRTDDRADRVTVTAYFDNSNGIFTGDEIRILGVRVGAVQRIEPQPKRSKITFWYDRRYSVPANATAAILSPSLVTARAIQLVPAYSGGPAMQNGAVIPQSRTAVPVEWDDLRAQLKRLADSLQPTQPGGVSPLGSLVNTGADNVRGQGANIRDMIVNLSQAMSTLGDHSTDIFASVKNLSVLVSALHDSSDLLAQLNRNFAAVTALLANDPTEIDHAVRDLSEAATNVQSFVADNREALGTTVDKLSSISTALVDSIDDVKQALHGSPTVLANFTNIYQPAQGSISGVLAVNNFANPISLVCGAIQAASRLGGEQAAKLCVQYLAPIIKNRQYNFPPLGENLFVGAKARPNEITYSEDRMRPDYVPPQGPPPPNVGPPSPQGPANNGPPLPAATSAEPAPAAGLTDRVSTDPAAGLPGMMVPSGGAS